MSKCIIYVLVSFQENITLDGLQFALKEKEIFSFSRTTLHKLLPEIGFKYKKDDNRRALCEKMNVVEQRIRFLRKYKTNETKEKSNVIFLDETWIFVWGSARKSGLQAG